MRCAYRAVINHSFQCVVCKHGSWHACLLCLHALHHTCAWIFYFSELHYLLQVAEGCLDTSFRLFVCRHWQVAYNWKSIYWLSCATNHHNCKSPWTESAPTHIHQTALTTLSREEKSLVLKFLFVVAIMTAIYVVLRCCSLSIFRLGFWLGGVMVLDE